MKQVTKDTLKTMEVLRSCQTYAQYEVAYSMLQNLRNYHGTTYYKDKELCTWTRGANAKAWNKCKSIGSFV